MLKNLIPTPRKHLTALSVASKLDRLRKKSVGPSESGPAERGINDLPVYSGFRKDFFRGLLRYGCMAVTTRTTMAGLGWTAGEWVDHGKVRGLENRSELASTAPCSRKALVHRRPVMVHCAPAPDSFQAKTCPSPTYKFTWFRLARTRLLLGCRAIAERDEADNPAKREVDGRGLWVNDAFENTPHGSGGNRPS